MNAITLKPAGYMAFGVCDGKHVPLTWYAGMSELEVKRKVIDTARSQGNHKDATADDVMHSLGWIIKPIYSIDEL